MYCRRSISRSSSLLKSLMSFVPPARMMWFENGQHRRRRGSSCEHRARSMRRGRLTLVRPPPFLWRERSRPIGFSWMIAMDGKSPSAMVFQVAGTLAVLRDAALEGLIDLRRAIDRLRPTTFRASPFALSTTFEITNGGRPGNGRILDFSPKKIDFTRSQTGDFGRRIP